MFGKKRNWYQIVFIGSLIIFSGCSSNKNILNNYFDKNEISELHEIVKFYTGQICGTNFNSKCLKAKLEEIKIAFVNGNSLGSGLNTELAIELLNNLSTEIKDKIWIYPCGYRNGQERVNMKYGCLKPNSVYTKFLVKFGEETPLILEYANSINKMAFLHPATASKFIMNYEELRLGEIETIIVLAIHYLTKDQEKIGRSKLEK